MEKDFYLEKTLKDSNLCNLKESLLEIGLDSIMKDSLLKDIPVFSFINGLTKFGLNIKDRLFLKKILLFLFNIREVSEKERRKVIERIHREKKYRMNVGEKLIFILDKSDDLEKVDIIGNLFLKFLKKNISYDSFIRASGAINNVFLPDLHWFLELNPNTLYIVNEHANSLFACGILLIKVENRQMVNTEVSYEISEIGKLLLSICGKKK